jgi:uncharacterized membrane protein
MDHNVDLAQSASPAPAEGLVTLTHILYGLHAFSALMGALGPMLIVTAFLTGWPSLIAVIVNYVKRGRVRGTWLDSHFGWQLRTFWYAVLWALVAIVIWMTVVGILLAWALLVLLGIWVFYRLIRGWITLLERRPVPG